MDRFTPGGWQALLDVARAARAMLKQFDLAGAGAALLEPDDAAAAQALRDALATLDKANA